MQNTMTIVQIFEVEPELEAITELAYNLVQNGDSKWQVYSQAKAMAQPYVGWTAESGTLRNSLAYDLFIDNLCGVLGI